MPVRFAKLSDLDAILSVYAPYVTNTAFSFEYSVPTLEEFTQRFLSVTSQFPWLVWEEDGHVIGYAYGSPHHSRAAYRWCAEISCYLHPEHRGKGIGRQLYTVLEEILTRQGYLTVYAVVTTANQSSLAFHKALGYREFAQFPECGFKFGTWYGVTWLEKRLNSVEIPSNFPLAANSIIKNDENFTSILDNLTLS